MSALYSTAMLRQAVMLAAFPLLAAPDVRHDGRTPVCGSRITVDLMIGADLRISAVGVAAQSCAVGQAASALMAQGVVGMGTTDFPMIVRAIENWLADGRAPLPGWPGFALLAPVRAYPARHAALLLPFHVAAEALHLHAQAHAA